MSKVIVGACAAIAVLTTACASAAASHTTSTRNAVAPAAEFHGQWVLTETLDNGHVTDVPASFDVYLIFGKHHEIRGFDGCGYFDGTLRQAPGGATRAVDVKISGNGCLELPAPLATARSDIDIALYRTRSIILSETVHRLTITTSGHTLVYVPRR